MECQKDGAELPYVRRMLNRFESFNNENGRPEIPPRPLKQRPRSQKQPIAPRPSHEQFSNTQQKSRASPRHSAVYTSPPSHEEFSNIQQKPRAAPRHSAVYTPPPSYEEFSSTRQKPSAASRHSAVYTEHFPDAHQRVPAAPSHPDPESDYTSITSDLLAMKINAGTYTAFDEMVKELGMEDFTRCKLTLSDFLNIGPDTVENSIPQSIQDLPWYFLQKIMALNISARDTSLGQSVLEGKDEDFGDFYSDLYANSIVNVPIHHLDVLCAILHCSNSFLQQEIVTKMSMCQFALPLLLPPGGGIQCTFMLWPANNIVRSWQLQTDKMVNEDNLVNIPMPTFSFTRLGECKLSKSKVINSILNITQINHDIFVNRDMECGSVPKTISDGLVEFFSIFPGNESHIFLEPFTVTNLRGDLRSHLDQFNFLTRVSTMVFVFIDEIIPEYVNFLLQYEGTDTQFCLIVDANKNAGAKELLQLLIKRLKCLPLGHHGNLLVLEKNLQKCILQHRRDRAPISIADMAVTASQLGIEVDEYKPECKRAREHALAITQNIKDVLVYKKETLTLQGDLWKKISKAEKEMCRMKSQGSIRALDYKNNLQKEKSDLRETQSQSEIPSDIKQFIDIITRETSVKKSYFIKWLKFYLDAIARKSLLKLRVELKQKQQLNQSVNTCELKDLSQKISDSSLGVEHFLRELAQLYEAECEAVNQERIFQRQFAHLPGIAADLMLDGFSLELMDGDASNIPLMWITGVFKELDSKTGGGCKIRVITVLGVQSSGKSTLLNAMFGLQFPVASGRCTRGAFMSLIKVKENFQMELGCHFILVIDTEGLKAPELASLEDSYEHDNELATLVVGLSDITLVNISMENVTEMKETLQIVVHAFLRMSEVGKKPSCYFVHQNVSDIAAEQNNIANRISFLEDLNKMTKLAAKMEKISKTLSFTDVIDHHPEENSWYIPNLFYGVSPMTVINTGYSKKILSLKAKLFQSLKESSLPESQSLNSFSQWISSLWKAVKYENFIFNFRNVLVATAYNELLRKYSVLELNFKAQVHKWWAEQENSIRNELQIGAPAATLEQETTHEAQKLLDEEEQHMGQELESYFVSGQNHIHLAKQYKEDFLGYIKCVRKDLEVFISNAFWETVRIKEQQSIRERYRLTAEEKLFKRIENSKKKNNTSDGSLAQEYESAWADILPELLPQTENPKERNIDSEMLEYLRREMFHRAGAVREILDSVKCLKERESPSFQMDNGYLNKNNLFKDFKEIVTKDRFIKLNNIAVTTASMCQNYVTTIVSKRQDYNEIHCQKMLDMINNSLDQKEVRKLNPNVKFEVDLKLHILAKAAPHFQKMHDKHRSKIDPNKCLKQFKDDFFPVFQNQLRQKDDESKSRALNFYEKSIYPAVKVHIYKNLGRQIVSDILNSADAAIFNSQSMFQYSILKELLEINNLTNYLEYINRYEFFIKNWIFKYLFNRYNTFSKLEPLIQGLISALHTQMASALRDPRVRNSENITMFSTTFHSFLNKHLVISKSDKNMLSVQSNIDIHQFCGHLEYLLENLKHEILADMKLMGMEFIFEKLSFKPEEELFDKMAGCCSKCPFCRAPCEAAGANHREHFVSLHRPKGLAQYTWSDNNALCHSICSVDVSSNERFINQDTGGEWFYYRDYQEIYPNWKILPEQNTNASVYWKYVLTHFNLEFATMYNAEPAEIPEDWLQITPKQALLSLQITYNVF